MPAYTFPRLVVLRDVPARRPSSLYGIDIVPRLRAGLVVYAYPLDVPDLAAGDRAVTLEPGGPWFPMAADSLKEI